MKSSSDLNSILCIQTTAIYLGMESYFLPGAEHSCQLAVGCGLCGVFKCDYFGPDTGDMRR